MRTSVSMSKAFAVGQYEVSGQSLSLLRWRGTIGFTPQHVKIRQIAALAPNAGHLHEHAVAALLPLLFKPLIYSRTDNLTF